jgi:HK97 family phage prohead protease
MEDRNLSEKKEIRYLNITPELEFRALESTEETGPKIIGYASLYNQLSNQMKGWKDEEGSIIFREKMLPGCFDDALANPIYDIFYDVNHDDGDLIATLFSKTLRLFSDEKGLRFEADVDPKVSYANDLLNNVKSGRIYSNSFAFTVNEETWEKEGEIWIRSIVKVKMLFDVSSVTRAAYPNTEIATRSLQDTLQKMDSEKKKFDDIYRKNIEKMILEDRATRLYLKYKY